MTTTRMAVLDAAVDLVGTAGLRALTHVRVDERAGVPQGSTSNYFRTRAALLAGVVDRIVDREMQLVGAAFAPASAVELVDGLCGLLEHTTVANRTLTTARLMLFMEASHDASLRAAVSHGRTAMESSVVLALSRLGATDPHASASLLMAAFEGVILHRIARGDTTDPRPMFTLLANAALS